ncbi:MAG: hypothetical protein KF715_06765 [Candidatus Didemnitutus sp.]|nr:hypothetical protein [Candidatus Didemnitutus sp.]
MRRYLYAGFWLMAAAVFLRAEVNRAVTIEAPGEAVAGKPVSVQIGASTDATDGEQIGFLHAEYSIDEGLTWTGCCNLENAGKSAARRVGFTASATGGVALVRVRVAFRGGEAGDADFRGTPIHWDESWKNWRWPPAKYARIAVPPPQRVERSIHIDAPSEVAAGSVVSVAVSANTGENGERIGFFHADYSVDGGKTWTKFCYAEDSGQKLSREMQFAVGARGTKAIIRVRAAFRGGRDGDVDLAGKPIEWGQSWERWLSPPAKYAIIYVRGA